MSTLSQRLARLRDSGKMPDAGTALRTADSATGENGKDTSSNDPLAALRTRDRRKGSLRAGRETAAPAVEPDTVPPGEGWKQQADFVWERTIGGPALLSGDYTESFILPDGARVEDLVFYDLETTGLSGGAGNTAFLIGLGRQAEDAFSVTQLFLADYPGEEALLRRYAELAGEERPQVSFNGRSFDSQVLKTRFLLNRMLPLLPPQVDLLYPSRRLWKGILENQTLRTLEEQVLDFHRSDDLPGSEAPDAWFEWLEGKPERVEGVFRHNADDIFSLGRLAAGIEAWGAVRPEAAESYPAGAPVNPWGMALQWSHRNQELETAWLDVGRQQGERRCSMELAARYRRLGDMAAAREIWEELNLQGRNFMAAIELAKYWEHRERNPGKALEVLQPLAGLPVRDVDRKALLHRMIRLEAKIEKVRTGNQ